MWGSCSCYVLTMTSATVFQSDAPLDERRVIIRRHDGDVEMVELPWGLRPRDGDARAVNVVRSEGRTFPTRRCLVPASEFRDCRAVRPMRRRHPCPHAPFCAAARCLRRLSWPSLHQDNLYRPDMGSARRILSPYGVCMGSQPPCAGGSQRRSCHRQTLSPTACAQARSGDDMGTDEFDDRLRRFFSFGARSFIGCRRRMPKNSHSRHRFESVGGILRWALSLNFRAPHAH